MSLKHQTFDDSVSVAFGSITSAYVDLYSPIDDLDLVFISNSTNAIIYINIPSGYNDRKSVRLPPGCSISIDCRSNSKRIAKGVFQVKYEGAAPTSGEVTITGAR